MYRKYHEQLPTNIKEWLENRGITSNYAAKYFIGWNGSAITIPIFDRQGNFLFFKYRKDPNNTTDGPKYWYDKGHNTALYNEAILDLPQTPVRAPRFIICEGEFDCIILNESGFPAVTSTSGAGTFPEEWVDKFSGKDVYICMDNDDAGRRATVRLLFLFASAGIIQLPKTLGPHADITDYFMRYSADDFNTLIVEASAFGGLILPETLKDTIALQDTIKSLHVQYELQWVQEMAGEILQMHREELAHKQRKPKKQIDNTDKIQAAKQVPITKFFTEKPRRINGKLFYKCPFHNEKTASFLVDAHNKFHCFGCDAHGDVIDFVQKFSNVSWNEAIKILTGEGIIV